MATKNTAGTSKKTAQAPQENAEILQESAAIAEAPISAPANPVEVAEEPVKISGPFAALSEPVPTSKTESAPKGNGVKIEKDRPEQNGLKRPSAGSTCAIIWDTCDEISKTSGHTCTSAELFNALQGYNECTLRTQYARWRHFNGITGRLPNQQKTVKLPAEWGDAIDILSARLDKDSTAIVDLQNASNPAELVAWIAKHGMSL